MTTHHGPRSAQRLRSVLIVAIAVCCSNGCSETTRSVDQIGNGYEAVHDHSDRIREAAQP